MNKKSVRDLQPRHKRVLVRVDFTAQVEVATTTDELRQAFREAAAGPMKGIRGCRG